MPLVNTTAILSRAKRDSYAVGAFNVISLEFLNGVLRAAEEERSPVIINVAEVHFPHVDPEQIAPLVVSAAAKTDIPVVLNLDHGLSGDTIIRALQCGFSSVMYDASGKPFDTNVAETAAVVKMAHAVGVTVEGELGMVGGSEDGRQGARADRSAYTDPALAERYVRETGVDALAVSVGNVHGFYDGAPEIDYGLLEDIRNRTNVPLVLHGGSGLSDDDFREAIRHGICKVNIFTDMSTAAADSVDSFMQHKPGMLMQDIQHEVRQTVTAVVRDRMRIFGSAGAADKRV